LEDGRLVGDTNNSPISAEQMNEATS
jgi:hypothetical protein